MSKEKLKTFDELWEELKNDKEYGEQFRFIDRVVNQDKENERLKQQLADKDKEIKNIETYYKAREINIVKDAEEIIKKLESQLKNSRHQVCEEIRNAIKQAELKYEWKGETTTIEEVLDKIEKGEKR